MNIIPHPKKTEKISGSFFIKQGDVIFCDEQFLKNVRRFMQMVEQCANITLAMTDDIGLANIIFTRDESALPESYFIMLSQGVATIKCADDAGCFYAVETLRQLFDLDRPREQISCVDCYIEDSPKYRYRGLMLDICRHFFDADTIMRIIDIMSQVKLNKLHLHLSDDQGFRIEIKKYPELNLVGSTRNGSEVVKNGKRYVDDKVVSGYLTQCDIQKLVSYASERHIDIIPEIDLPGHCVALLTAFPQFSCTGQVTEVRKQWGISKDILCAGNEKVYPFICDVLDEICEMFPSQYVHLGGDEAPKDRWCNCKLCRERMAELNLSGFDELQTNMIEVFRKHLVQKGKTVICWNDGITPSSSKDIVMQVWKPFTTNQGAREANSGRKVIMSPFSKMYFDYPYGMTPLSKTLHYVPSKGVKKQFLSNVMGVEACLWTEYVEDTDKLFFNLLPRIDALAECAWGYRDVKFGKRMRKRFEIYEKVGLVYNGKATLNGCRKLHTVRNFFKKDANIELNEYLYKQK